MLHRLNFVFNRLLDIKLLRTEREFLFFGESNVTNPGLFLRGYQCHGKWKAAKFFMGQIIFPLTCVIMKLPDCEKKSSGRFTRLRKFVDIKYECTAPVYYFQDKFFE